MYFLWTPLCLRVGVSPVIDEKENATLRNMPKELLNEYFDAFIGMTKQASSKYNITFADCKNIGPHYVLLVNASLPMEIYKKDKQLPFVKSNAFIVFKKKIYLFMMDSWDTEETHLQQLTTIIKSLQPLWLHQKIYYKKISSRFFIVLKNLELSFFGATDRIWTCDPLITNEMLYQLSYSSGSEHNKLCHIV